MRIVLLVSLLIFSIICSAEIYMHTDKNGSVIYSDTPTKDAQIITLSNTSSPPPLASTPTTTNTNLTTEKSTIPDQVSPRLPYEKFLIDSPLDQQTINNQTSIPVVLLLKPDLQKGDTIQLYLDGTPQQSPASKTNFELSNIERGTHQLSAVLLDENKNTLKQTQTVTIFIHYAHNGASTS
jgi:hypothetical protein